MGRDRKVVGSFSGILVMDVADSHVETGKEDAMIVFDGRCFVVV